MILNKIRTLFDHIFKLLVGTVIDSYFRPDLDFQSIEPICGGCFKTVKKDYGAWRVTLQTDVSVTDFVYFLFECELDFRINSKTKNVTPKPELAISNKIA